MDGLTRPGSAPSLRRPALLAAGDEVMLVSPAGPTRPERVRRGIELLTGWGLRVQVAPNAYAQSGFLAGTDEQRLADLNLALRAPAVRGVICTRGGYGAQRIVDGIDLAAVRADPKVVVGFSDITAIQLALWRGARLATVHGPGAAWLDERLGDAAAAGLQAAMMSSSPIIVPARTEEDTSPLRCNAAAGPVQGTLIGGNLSLLAASIGTPDQPDLRGAIVLVEEVAEPPYKVDRMLVHLRRAGLLHGVAGIAVGQFTQCADDWPVSISEVLTEQLGTLGVPVLGGLPIGHGRDQLSVPVGVPATLDVAAGRLTVAPLSES